MKMTLALVAVAGFGLGACNSSTDPGMVASGGAAGDFGPEYCFNEPSDPTKQEQWAQLCNQNNR